jgi:myo-inositol-1(or 4)-monophosphatase
MNLGKITGKVAELARESGLFLMKENLNLTGKHIEEKGAHNFVTYADRESEKRLVEGLSKILPGAGFIAEEGHYGQEGAELLWILDPLDGTTNFVHHIPFFSVSIALREREKTLLGVVYETNRDECFYCWKGEVTMLNGKKVRVSPARTLKDSLLATGFPYLDEGRLEAYLKIFKDFTASSRGIRRLGSAAADLAYVSCGRFDGFYEYGLSPWDVAAGAFLVEQAGGKVTDMRGGADQLFGRQILASNRSIHNQMLATIRKHFG